MRTLFLLTGASLWLWSHPAAAAQVEPHAWIMNDPRYVTDKGVHCCGPAHCQPAAAGEISRVAGGWLHVPTGTVLSDASHAIYLSLDPQRRVWRCVQYDSAQGGLALQCLFVPGEG